MTFALNIVARFTIVLFGTAAACVLLRRGSASLRHALWIAAMASAALMPLAVAMTPQLEFSVPEATTSVTFLPASAQSAGTVAENRDIPAARVEYAA